MNPFRKECLVTPLRILLQTTIPFAQDDWHVGRFSLLARELGGARVDGRPIEVTARDRASAGDDPVLRAIDRSNFDELWLLAVDTGSGLTAAESEALVRFRERGGGLLTARDHQDLGSCLACIPGPGQANYFRSRNLDPVEQNRCDDDCLSAGISWPNYHSGKNGDVQRLLAVEPLHPVLRRPDGSTIEWLPAHPHEGAIGVPNGEDARVIAIGRSATTRKAFNLAVAFDGAKLGRAIVASSFHHFVDYNWDTRMGAPSFVTDPEGSAIRESPELLADVKTYVRNLVRWLAPGASA
jgi:hypothetical protein